MRDQRELGLGEERSGSLAADPRRGEADRGGGGNRAGRAGARRRRPASSVQTGASPRWREEEAAGEATGRREGEEAGDRAGAGQRTGRGQERRAGQEAAGDGVGRSCSSNGDGGGGARTKSPRAGATWQLIPCWTNEQLLFTGGQRPVHIHVR